MILEDSGKVIEFIKNPQKLVMAVVKDENEKFNAITLEWFMRTSIKPLMFAISIGHPRYSHSCLQTFRFFNLCYPSPDLVEMTRISGTQSGRDIDKFTVGNVDYFPGKLAKLPVMRTAAANFECEIVTQVRSGDHTIFVGEVKYSWYNPEKRVITYADF